MVTAQAIIEILESAAFQKELDELSTYAASMKQERPIVLLLSKYFWGKGLKASPELKKCDLDVDGTKIEFKFHYDSDVLGTCGEMKARGVTYKSLRKAITSKILHPTWTTTPGIFKDIYDKKADIFVWIICSRNLSNLTKDDRQRVCWSEPLGKFKKDNQIGRAHV